MFKRFMRWFRDEQVLPPKPLVLPDDPWERMVELNDLIYGAKLGPLEIKHFDVRPALYSDNVSMLFERLEMLILSIEQEDVQHPTWQDRRREPLNIAIPDYYYSSKFGYREPQEVFDIISKKILIVHNLLEDKGVTAGHTHYPYLKREFTSVVLDTIEVLWFSASLRPPETN